MPARDYSGKYRGRFWTRSERQSVCRRAIQLSYGDIETQRIPALASRDFSTPHVCQLAPAAAAASVRPAAMSEIERLRALARYAWERDRLPLAATEASALIPRWQGMYAVKRGERLVPELARNARRALGVVPRDPRSATRNRWLVRALLSGLVIDVSFVGTDRSLNVGLTSADYFRVAEIGALLYAALALVVLARRFWRQSPT